MKSAIRNVLIVVSILILVVMYVGKGKTKVTAMVGKHNAGRVQFLLLDKGVQSTTVRYVDELAEFVITESSELSTAASAVAEDAKRGGYCAQIQTETVLSIFKSTLDINKDKGMLGDLPTTPEAKSDSESEPPKPEEKPQGNTEELSQADSEAKPTEPTTDKQTEAQPQNP